jgi:hypothetical protein
MPVAIQRQYRRLVAEQLLNHLHVRPGADCQRRAGVPEVVKSNPVDPADRQVSFLNIRDPQEPVHSPQNSPGRTVRFPSVTGESEFSSI